MSVYFVTRAIQEPAIDISVVKFEPVQDLDVIVEILGVDYEDVFFICDVKASVLVAVEVSGAQIRTQVVGTFRIFPEYIKTLQAVVLQLQQ